LGVCLLVGFFFAFRFENRQKNPTLFLTDYSTRPLLNNALQINEKMLIYLVASVFGESVRSALATKQSYCNYNINIETKYVAL